MIVLNEENWIYTFNWVIFSVRKDCSQKRIAKTTKMIYLLPHKDTFDEGLLV